MGLSSNIFESKEFEKFTNEFTALMGKDDPSLLDVIKGKNFNSISL
jgi:hypothetical protein